MEGGNRLRVLVADDNPDWRYLLTKVLRPEYDVAGYAERGDKIIEVARDLQPDVITLDISMPGQSGLGALTALRAALPKAIIVVVSGTVRRLYQEEAFMRGADAFITKDRVLSDLVVTILMARKRQSEEQQRRASGYFSALSWLKRTL